MAITSWPAAIRALARLIRKLKIFQEVLITIAMRMQKPGLSGKVSIVPVNSGRNALLLKMREMKSRLYQKRKNRSVRTEIGKKQFKKSNFKTLNNNYQYLGVNYSILALNTLNYEPSAFYCNILPGFYSKSFCPAKTRCLVVFWG